MSIPGQCMFSITIRSWGTLCDNAGIFDKLQARTNIQPLNRPQCRRGPDLLVLERLTAAMADMQDVYGFVLDREEYPIHVWLSAVEEMANLEREDRVLRS